MDLEIMLGALCAVLVLFAWSEWRLGKIAGAALVFTLKSGFLAVLIITIKSAGSPRLQSTGGMRKAAPSTWFL